VRCGIRLRRCVFDVLVAVQRAGMGCKGSSSESCRYGNNSCQAVTHAQESPHTYPATQSTTCAHPPPTRFTRSAGDGDPSCCCCCSTSGEVDAPPLPELLRRLPLLGRLPPPAFLADPGLSSGGCRREIGIVGASQQVLAAFDLRQKHRSTRAHPTRAGAAAPPAHRRRTHTAPHRTCLQGIGPSAAASPPGSLAMREGLAGCNLSMLPRHQCCPAALEGPNPS